MSRTFCNSNCDGFHYQKAAFTKKERVIPFLLNILKIFEYPSEDFPPRKARTANAAKINDLALSFFTSLQKLFHLKFESTFLMNQFFPGLYFSQEEQMTFH